jgi:caa(3)-type oxidase subunit IV
MSEEHAHPGYVKIWAILLVLLAVSIAGPEIGIQWITLLTAFGIALVKAYMVAKHFMHLNQEPRYIPYLLITAIVFMVLLFAGTAPDVMKDDGAGWEKPAWVADSAIDHSAAAHGEAAHH